VRRRETACLVVGIVLLGWEVGGAMTTSGTGTSVVEPPCEQRILRVGDVDSPGVRCWNEDAAGPPGSRVEVVDGVERVQPLVGAAALAIGARIDANTASAADLEAIPGIGPALATAIVEERARGGRFRSIDDVERVRGIGPVRLLALRRWLSVRP